MPDHRGRDAWAWQADQDILTCSLWSRRRARMAPPWYASTARMPAAVSRIPLSLMSGAAPWKGQHRHQDVQTMHQIMHDVTIPLQPSIISFDHFDQSSWCQTYESCFLSVQAAYARSHLVSRHTDVLKNESTMVEEDVISIRGEGRVKSCIESGIRSLPECCSKVQTGLWSRIFTKGIAQEPHMQSLILCKRWNKKPWMLVPSAPLTEVRAGACAFSSLEHLSSQVFLQCICACLTGSNRQQESELHRDAQACYENSWSQLWKGHVSALSWLWSENKRHSSAPIARRHKAWQGMQAWSDTLRSKGLMPAICTAQKTALTSARALAYARATGVSWACSHPSGAAPSLPHRSWGMGSPVAAQL